MTRRVLHILRTEKAHIPRGGALCEPASNDRVVILSDVTPSELVSLIFEFDGVVVW